MGARNNTNTIERRHALCKKYGVDGCGREQRLALLGVDPQDASLARQRHEQAIVPGLGAIIDEFILLPLDTNMAIVLAVAERIRAKISQDPVCADDICLHMTIALGCVCAEPGHDVDSVIAHADGALYRAKHAGRDRVVVHEDTARH